MCSRALCKLRSQICRVPSHSERKRCCERFSGCRYRSSCLNARIHECLLPGKAAGMATVSFWTPAAEDPPESHRSAFLPRARPATSGFDPEASLITGSFGTADLSNPNNTNLQSATSTGRRFLINRYAEAPTYGIWANWIHGEFFRLRIPPKGSAIYWMRGPFWVLFEERGNFPQFYSLSP